MAQSRENTNLNNVRVLVVNSDKVLNYLEEHGLHNREDIPYKDLLSMGVVAEYTLFDLVALLNMCLEDYSFNPEDVVYVPVDIITRQVVERGFIRV